MITGSARQDERALDEARLVRGLLANRRERGSDRATKLRAIATILDRRFGDVAEISAAHLR